MIDSNEVQRRYDLWLQGYWEVPDNLDTSNFDFEWRPEPYDRPYTHQFGTQHQKTGGPRFIIPDSEGIKYQTHQHAIRLPDQHNRSWRPLIPNCTIDFSWHPDDTEPPFIYVFGNQWYNVDTMPTYQYRVKGATEKKYMYDVTATLLPNLENWITPDDIDETQFDYSWVPHPHEPPFIWQFGTQWQKSGGPAYVTKDATVKKYSDILKSVSKYNPERRGWRPLKSNITFDYSWHPDENEPPYIYVFGNQWYNGEKMPTVLYRVKGATEKKYVTDIRAILLPNKDNFKALTDRKFEFDYSWCPDPGDPPYTYVFGNQWHDSKTMPTLMYVTDKSIATKYVDDVKAKMLPDTTNWEIPEDITGFDYSWCPDPGDPPLIYQFGTQHQKTGGPRYVNGTDVKFIDTIKATKLPNMRNWRIIEQINKDTFDFSWHPDDTEGSYNYVFGNKFHSPEIMPTVMYRNKQSIGSKYITDQKADLIIEKITYEDSIFDAFMDSRPTTAYIHITKNENTDYSMLTLYKPSVHLLNNEAIVPTNIKSYLYDKLTDYGDYRIYDGNQDIEPLDIIFLSNGERIADKNYQHLLEITKDKPNRVIRIDGVNGRVASQHAAATASKTSWYFLVNGKLEVNKDFDFNWQPNIYKSRRHYIFTATNPVNGLEYGHMAIVMNNKKLTLETIVRGLDFTMDSRTEVVPANSGIARYNSSEWDTWRTAFRECVKLCNDNYPESQDRLKAWTTQGNGDFGEYSIRGAMDAIEYFYKVNGEMSKLMLSYDWAWLKDYYNQLNKD